MDGSHGARRQGLHQAAPRRHHKQRVRQREHAGQMGCHVFADAVAHHRGGRHAPLHPQRRQRVLGAEQRRLGQPRFVDPIVRALGKHDRADVQPEHWLQQGGAAVDGSTIDRLTAVQFRTHANVLAALSAEQERDRPRAAFMHRSGNRGMMRLSQQRHGLRDILHRHRTAMREWFAPDLQGPGNVLQRQVRMRLEVCRKIGRRLLKADRRSCRQDEQLVVMFRVPQR